ncbi:MAG: alkaline phosphatase family protein, partial [Bdellovibrionota bacterium]
MSSSLRIMMVLGILGLMISPAYADDPAPDCSRAKGSLPDPSRPAGTPDKTPIEHIVLIMQENHSFDSYLGRLNAPEFYGSAIDGVTPEMTNLDKYGIPVHAFHQTSFTVADTDHGWKAEHYSWDEGRNDHFAEKNGAKTMGYYEASELPEYYALANQFAVSDRYFCS